MQTINLFPIEFFEFRNRDINNQQIIKVLDNLKGPIRNGSVLSYVKHVHKEPELSNLFSWFERCLEEIRVRLHYQCDKFEITSSWYNKALANSGMHQNYHKHVLSFFSGVYYLTEGSPTFFEDPVIQRSQGQIEVLRDNYQPFEKINAEPGKLVIFPSWVYHQTPPHIMDNDRYIISFNSLPTGNINPKSTIDSQCYISVKND